MEWIVTLWGAVSWTWVGAAVLCGIAGALAIYLGQIQLGVFLIAAAVILTAVGGIITDRNLAIAERDKAYTRAEKAEKDLTDRVEEADKRVKAAEAKVAKQDQDRRKFENDQKLKLQASATRVADLERRLRESSPVDSDGKPVSVTGSCPGEVQGASEGRIPVADYRRAQAEALEAAVRVQEMRGYITGLVDLGVLRWE